MEIKLLNFIQTNIIIWMEKASKKLLALLVLIVLAQTQRVLLEPAVLKPHMFTE